MYIEWKREKLRNSCEDETKAVRTYGAQQARKIAARLADIKAATTLAELNMIPGIGCHPLKGDRRGQFAVYLKHPYRLVFEPVGDPSEISPDGQLNLSKVTRVRILEVKDYHG